MFNDIESQLDEVQAFFLDNFDSIIKEKIKDYDLANELYRAGKDLIEDTLTEIQTDNDIESKLSFHIAGKIHQDMEIYKESIKDGSLNWEDLCDFGSCEDSADAYVSSFNE